MRNAKGGKVESCSRVKLCRSDLHTKEDKLESKREETQSVCGFYRFEEGIR